jgi:hypothetical protein
VSDTDPYLETAVRLNRRHSELLLNRLDVKQVVIANSYGAPPRTVSGLPSSEIMSEYLAVLQEES